MKFSHKHAALLAKLKPNSTLDITNVLKKIYIYSICLNITFIIIQDTDWAHLSPHAWFLIRIFGSGPLQTLHEDQRIQQHPLVQALQALPSKA